MRLVAIATVLVAARAGLGWPPAACVAVAFALRFWVFRA